MGVRLTRSSRWDPQSGGQPTTLLASAHSRLSAVRVWSVARNARLRPVGGCFRVIAGHQLRVAIPAGNRSFTLSFHLHGHGRRGSLWSPSASPTKGTKHPCPRAGRWMRRRVPGTGPGPSRPIPAGTRVGWSQRLCRWTVGSSSSPTRAHCLSSCVRWRLFWSSDEVGATRPAPGCPRLGAHVAVEGRGGGSVLGLELYADHQECKSDDGGNHTSVGGNGGEVESHPRSVRWGALLGTARCYGSFREGSRAETFVDKPGDRTDEVTSPPRGG